MAPKGFLVLVFVPSPPQAVLQNGWQIRPLFGRSSEYPAGVTQAGIQLFATFREEELRTSVGLWDARGFLCSLPDRLQSRLEGLPIENCMFHCLSCELSLKLCRSSFVLDCSGLQQAKSPPGRGWLHMPVPHVVPACTNEMI
ncbi:hypothetical protein BGZ61DRAFT_476405 [Ilyonectria robusta]|uniref:uncharacterized protein n=1 Tax=Ilyonectria robusta TaxID=1079257 RepID=UPI001E8E927B|nr:uncharacterized protein BGZ61DRAFT_476405 [Ilyonectria robusta]KAH8714310.1 hypothetical protein BGZ61DRAFT_476405 [Ilyonectria robusta]